MSDLSATSELWEPLRGVLAGVAVAFVFALGVWMMAVAAPGKMGDISRWLLSIFTGKWVRRIGGSVLLVACGIAADVHFSPALFVAPTQAGPGVLAGSTAIAGGLALLFTRRGSKARKKLVALAAVVSLVLCGGCAAGTAIEGL